MTGLIERYTPTEIDHGYVAWKIEMYFMSVLATCKVQFLTGAMCLELPKSKVLPNMMKKKGRF